MNKLAKDMLAFELYSDKAFTLLMKKWKSDSLCSIVQDFSELAYRGEGAVKLSYSKQASLLVDLSSGER